MLLNGITTIEAKSGYGLTTEHELKQLEVAKKLNEDHEMDIISPLLWEHMPFRWMIKITLKSLLILLLTK